MTKEEVLLEALDYINELACGCVVFECRTDVGLNARSAIGGPVIPVTTDYGPEHIHQIRMELITEVLKDLKQKLPEYKIENRAPVERQLRKIRTNVVGRQADGAASSCNKAFAR